MELTGIIKSVALWSEVAGKYLFLASMSKKHVEVAGR